MTLIQMFGEKTMANSKMEMDKQLLQLMLMEIRKLTTIKHIQMASMTTITMT